jgi:biopolymer transport protein TolQ
LGGNRQGKIPRRAPQTESRSAAGNSAGISVERAAQTRQLLDAMPDLHFFSPVFATTNLIEVFARCDPVGQVIVGGLAVASIIAWSIMIGKHYELKRLRQWNHAFESHLHDQRNILELPETFKNKRAIPYADLFTDAIESYWRAAAIGKEKGETDTRARLEHTENALQRALSRQTLRYESSMIFLATIVTGAPFLGMLGTVWGVMEAFSAVAVQESASIKTLAPGVSAALLTTIAGLLVAIPSVFGYNFLLGKSKQLITEAENFASELADRIELESK